MPRTAFVSLILASMTATAFGQSPPTPDIAAAKTSIAESPPAPSAEHPQTIDPTDELPKSQETTTEQHQKTSTNPLEEFLKPTFRIRGLIETEAIVATQSKQSKATIGDLQNGYGFRRARLGAQGTIGDSSRWVSDIELASGTVQLLDVFIGLTAIPGVRELRVGHFREPFSLEGMTSVNFLTFMERSPLNALDPARNWGIAGYWWPDNETALFALGVFRDGTINGQSLGDEDTWTYTARLTGLPIYEPDGDVFRLLHIGTAFSQRRPSNGVVVFNPGTAPSLLSVVDNPDTPFLPPVSIPANTQQLYNLQAAYVAGPLSLQGEWSATAIHQVNAGVVFLHGFYAQASYFLTGEHRGYDATRGAFGQVKVHKPMIRTRDIPGGGLGAIEVAARYSFYDFSSSNLPPAMDGTTSRALLHQFELGVNWYLNDYTRIMFNYTLPFVEKIGRETTSAQGFGIRAALYW